MSPHLACSVRFPLTGLSWKQRCLKIEQNDWSILQGCKQICLSIADSGDGPWAGSIPEAASKEIKQAKGKVYEMTSDPWW